MGVSWSPYTTCVYDAHPPRFFLIRHDLASMIYVQKDLRPKLPLVPLLHVKPPLLVQEAGQLLLWAFQNANACRVFTSFKEQRRKK